MDPFSTLTGAIGLFNTCLHAYRKVAAAVEVGSDRFTWDVMMRIERTRFEVWGRTLGFLDGVTGAERTPGADVDILKVIVKALQEFEEAADKYGLQPKSSVDKAGEASGQGRSERKREQLRKLWGNTRDFTKHLWLVVKDENMMEELLQRLSRLNDGLDKLYSSSQRAQSAKALSAGVLTQYDEASELSTLWDRKIPAATKGAQGGQPASLTDEILNPTRHPVLSATAQVKQMCIGTPGDSGSNPDMAADASIKDSQKQEEIGSYEIPIDKVKVHETPKSTRSDRFWPLGSATYTADDESDPVEVLVEWRLPHPVSPGSHVRNEELERRRDLIVHLLHTTSNLESAAAYRVLDCIGYIKYQGRVDGALHNVVGFLSRLPSWADNSAKPVTLHKLLSDSFESDEPGMVPSLNERLTIARSISNALYQLQCSRRLHRSFTSANIVFFIEKETGLPKLEEPYLIGLQYPRPDDQPHPIRPAIGVTKGASGNLSAPHSEMLGVESWGALAIYLHPRHSSTYQRYRRSDDIYSLGMVLVEIAFWEPLNAFVVGQETVFQGARKILSSVKVELASEVGEIYRDATLKCLTGLRPVEDGEGDSVTVEQAPHEAEVQVKEYDGVYAGEDPEVGLEDDLLWKVIREIEKCHV